ncbi:MAG: hypothetical protein ABSH20_06635 [Tepidisphaeraceae bacterium]|jgi:mannose-6-phosphate isomerase
MLYPLKFLPVTIGQPWGGRRLAEFLGMQLPAGQTVAESWGLLDSPSAIAAGSTEPPSSVVANGPLAGRTLHQIIADLGPSMHGDVPLVPPAGQFPVQVRFVDAREDSSLRVNITALALYAIRIDPGPGSVRRLSPHVSDSQLKQAISDGTADSLCDCLPIKAGECMLLPPGTVYAIGAGVLAVEIQSPGEWPGLLSVPDALALGRIPFGLTPAKPQRRSHVAGLFTTVTRLIACEDFIIEKVRFVEGVEEAVPYDQPVVWVMLEGQAEIRVDGLKDPVTFGRGDTVLIPAKMKNPIIKTLANCVWLEVTFPTKGGL